jgi:hypothetical protein
MRHTATSSYENLSADRLEAAEHVARVLLDHGLPVLAPRLLRIDRPQGSSVVLLHCCARR